MLSLWASPPSLYPKEKPAHLSVLGGSRLRYWLCPSLIKRPFVWERASKPLPFGYQVVLFLILRVRRLSDGEARYISPENYLLRTFIRPWAYAYRISVRLGAYANRISVRPGMYAYRRLFLCPNFRENLFYEVG